MHIPKVFGYGGDVFSIFIYTIIVMFCYAGMKWMNRTTAVLVSGYLELLSPQILGLESNIVSVG